MNNIFKLKVDGFIQISDSSEISKLVELYKDSQSILYSAIACNSSAMLQIVSERMQAEANVTVQGILNVMPSDVNEDITTTTSIKGVHINFNNCEGNKDLVNIGNLAVKCAALNIMTYISNMEWDTFEKLFNDYRDATFVYILPSNNIKETLSKIQDRIAQDDNQVKLGTIAPLFVILGLYDIHNSGIDMKWIAQNIPLAIETINIGLIRPINLSSETSKLFLLNKISTVRNNITTADIGIDYIAYLLKQIIKRTNWN